VPVIAPGVAGNVLTVTNAVPVSCAEQPVEVIVASTLNVVVTARLPVGRLIDAPVPITADPTLTLPTLLRN